jgi:hypothetical protein
MVVQKQVVIKLFFNLSNRTFYVQIGDSLFKIKDTVAGAIQEKEKLDIRHVSDIKEMQTISNQD